MYRGLCAALALSTLLSGCSKSAKVEAQADAEGVRGSAEVDGDEPEAAAPSGSWDDGGAQNQPGDGRAAVAAPSGERGLATLPGFRMFRDGSSRVFVEVSGRVAVSESRSDERVVVHLEGVRVPEKVNKMDLPTTHFPTPVGRVRLVQVNADADLVIELRSPSPAKMRVNQSEDATVVSVDFPRFGSPPAAAPAPPPSDETP